MTLTASPPIKASDINVELGRSAGAAFDINGATERALAGVASGAIKFSDFLSKSSRSVELVHTSSSASEVANYGADATGRWIVVIALGGNNSVQYGLSATISGVAGTIIKRDSSGEGTGPATGVAIIVGQPSGTSGTVAISGITGTRRFYVLRVMGYDLSAAVFSDDANGSGIPPWSANVPANGLAIAVNQSGPSGPASISWTGITEQIADASLISNHVSSVAWDINMAANGAKAIDVTASDINGYTAAAIATFNPS